MITSRFPIWRTNPAGFAVAGLWPVPIGVLAVLFIPPMIGLLIMAATSGADMSATSPIVLLASLLTYSPLLSWIPMIVAVPISSVLARVGYAGWAVAAIGGFLGGFLTGVITAVSVSPTRETLMFAVTGIVLGLIYWGAIRAVHPITIGVAFRKQDR